MNIEIANRLIQMRKEKGLSQEELASKLGISRQSVSKWERAEASPDTDNLICLAQIYGVSLDSLLKTDQPISEIVSEEKDKQKSGDTVNINIGSKGVYIDSDGKVASKTGGLSPQEEEYCRNTLHLDRVSIFKKMFDASLWLLAITGYIVASALTGLWHPLWLIMFIPIIIDSLIDCFIEKDFSWGGLPVLISGVYLLIGFGWNLWHPYWIMFLFIPVFYGLSELLNYCFHKGKYNKDHKLIKKYLRTHPFNDKDDDDKDDD